ncbi:hypothetical protein [Bifidobacterium adolescentis]|uniref:hypothetical protein n=1 Tax=Bifidobacterium adolescentis TaxID=1680 RepID=UPI0004E5DDD7|nr:hypothetical protein [Bifidobacterium adolescentis]AII76639.1 hypothetical protein BADO_1228 [Bifidobacterium adolescentis]
MTIELVDGKAGVAHISSEDKAIIHQAKFSKSDVVFDWGDAFKCSMSSPNRATIGTGCASIQGLDWHITAAESVTISNGSQGVKRNDIICAHYHRDSKTGNELVELTVLKGTPNATTAADPTIPSGKILSGAVDAYMPLWRIPLDGITVGTPVRLFTPKGALWDSVTLYNADGFVVIKAGILMLVKFSGAIGVGSWDAKQCKYVLPEAYRPPIEVNSMCCVTNGQTARMLIVQANGIIRVANMGSTGSSQGCVGTVVYPIC